MREIKFRAFDSINKVMEYNVNVNQGKPVKKGYQWFNTENTVYHSELMQYTGLKDKNGKGIYEGDILKCHHKTLGKVFFHDGSYRLSSDQCELNLDDIRSYDNLDHYLIEDNNLVVIGNIFENPSLLEAAE
ncbi:YopX family protein [Priestia flexa]|uniref:YopX family protein n=1 Tax=Priestia flexa TaxID=86664 RepID=UPI003D2650B5